MKVGLFCVAVLYLSLSDVKAAEYRATILDDECVRNQGVVRPEVLAEYKTNLTSVINVFAGNLTSSYCNCTGPNQTEAYCYSDSVGETDTAKNKTSLEAVSGNATNSSDPLAISNGGNGTLSNLPVVVPQNRTHEKQEIPEVGGNKTLSLQKNGTQSLNQTLRAGNNTQGNQTLSRKRNLTSIGKPPAKFQVRGKNLTSSAPLLETKIAVLLQFPKLPFYTPFYPPHDAYPPPRPPPYILPPGVYPPPPPPPVPSPDNVAPSFSPSEVLPPVYYPQTRPSGLNRVPPHHVPSIVSQNHQHRHHSLEHGINTWNKMRWPEIPDLRFSHANWHQPGYSNRISPPSYAYEQPKWFKLRTLTTLATHHVPIHFGSVRQNHSPRDEFKHLYRTHRIPITSQVSNN